MARKNIANEEEIDNGVARTAQDHGSNGETGVRGTLQPRCKGIYQDAADMLMLKPEEVLMVACHAEDLAGARKAGLKTAYVNRPLEFGAGSTFRGLISRGDLLRAGFGGQ